MISILLTILKILGLLLLSVLGILLVLILLVLFVPVRYRIVLHRKETEKAPVTAKVSITWLLHMVSAVFSYPEEAYVKIKLFFITVFRSDQPPKEKIKKEKKQKEKTQKKSHKTEEGTKNEKINASRQEEKRDVDKENDKEEQRKTEQEEDKKEQKENSDNTGEDKESKEDFFKKLLSILKNIKYTITKICDKIKHIVNNIRYYIDILKSDTFRMAWSVCSPQVFGLLKSILPNKIQGKLRIGTGDPASTGQVLAAYGILYPLLGNHIEIIPDFEQQIVEGDLLIKGKITFFRLVKTAWIVYFNKNLRQLIKLFKREAA